MQRAQHRNCNDVYRSLLAELHNMLICVHGSAHGIEIKHYFMQTTAHYDNYSDKISCVACASSPSLLLKLLRLFVQAACFYFSRSLCFCAICQDF